MEKQIEAKVKPEEQKRHLIKAYLDDEEYEKFQLFAKACKCTNSNFVRQLLAGAHLVAFPPDDYMRLSSEFVKIGININQIARIANRDGFIDTKEYEELHLSKTAEHTRAYIKVQDGCNQFCTYCIIPYARGRVRSRSRDSVIEEVTTLAANLNSFANESIRIANNG